MQLTPFIWEIRDSVIILDSFILSPYRISVIISHCYPYPSQQSDENPHALVAALNDLLVVLIVIHLYVALCTAAFRTLFSFCFTFAQKEHYRAPKYCESSCR